MTIISPKMKDYEFASVATAPISMPNQQEMRVCNLQLNAWINARDKYKQIKDNENPNLDDMILTANLLGDSLTYLFGTNYNINSKTPALKTLIEKFYPEDRDWNLKSDDINLYEHFIELDEFHKDITKHFNRTKTAKANELTKKKLEIFVETTKEIWIWFLKKYFNDDIPSEQLTEFEIV